MDQGWFQELWEKMPPKVKDSQSMMVKTRESLEVRSPFDIIKTEEERWRTNEM